MTDLPTPSVTLACRIVLLDIEGTVSPVAFVYDVMFPFVREQVASFLRDHWTQDAVKTAVALLGQDLGQPELANWLGGGSAERQQQIVVKAVNQLMDQDAKVTGLKQLQGLVWKDGFDGGQLVAELFPDVLPQLQNWKSAGWPLYIYSSGSVGAQKLFFGHTTAGNVLDLFSGHFDTTVGPKKEASSYTAIAAEIGRPASEICFISDVTAELDAAALAGMSTILRVADPAESTTHDLVTDLRSITLQRTP